MISVKNLYLDNINNLSFDINENDYIYLESFDCDSLKKYFMGDKNFIGYTMSNDIIKDNLFTYIDNEDISLDKSIYDYLASDLRKYNKEKFVTKAVDDILIKTNFYDISGVSLNKISINQRLVIKLLKTILDNNNVIVLDKSLNNEYIINALSNIYSYNLKIIFMGFNNKLVNKILKIISKNDYYCSSINLIDKEQEYIILDASIINNILKVNDNEIALNDIFKERVIDNVNKIKLDRRKFSFNNLSNDLCFKINSSKYENSILEAKLDNFNLYFNYYKDTSINRYVYYPIEDIVFLNDDNISSIDFLPRSNNIKCNVINSSIGAINIDSYIVSLNKRLNKKMNFVSISRNDIYELSNEGLSINRIYSATCFKDFIYVDGLFNKTRLNIKIKTELKPIELLNKKVKINGSNIIINNYY